MHFPKADEGRTFDLSVVMAGAVSGGAYQGGVMDFLIQALDAWNDAKAQGGDPGAISGGVDVPLPSHHVVLRGFAGTSAGSYTAAMATVALRYEFPAVTAPAHEPAEHSLNPFFEAWVNRVDISDLLGVRDFDALECRATGGVRVTSLLDCTAIDQTVDDLLDMGGATDERLEKSRDWVAVPLAVRLTLGNLRGVPYGFPLGHGSTLTHAMTAHADMRDFAVPARGTHRVAPLAHYTDLPGRNDSAVWKIFGDAAKGSAAFPFALRPRLIDRPASEYDGRTFFDPGDGTPEFPPCDRPVPPLVGMPTDYRFIAMDGGIMNNEPLELGRALLLTRPGEHNPRAGVAAKRAVLMIDPFVDPADISQAQAPTFLWKLLAPLLNAWKAQCRFKPEDLAMAGKQNIYSRFIIAPTRSLPPRPSDVGPDAPPPNPLAAGGLGAFLGFFSRVFRVHDFQLGRRNAQHFLRLALEVPCGNPIVAPWWDGLDSAQKVEAIRRGWAYEDDDGIHIPLIPLVAAVRDEIPELAWPEAPDSQSFRASLLTRLDRLVAETLKENRSGLLVRVVVRLVWCLWLRWKAADAVLAKLDEAFRAQWFGR